ncbi:MULTISPECIES: RDD family protein [unclassified Lysinibacillus]|uniref:RDD family protein n=1 Tax=unclassified Lysinibacillus TaxID=2636778 RepID=UPI001168DA7C|nr:RDD family protein [Lysinibacillus sp. CD3-6]QPQ34689.1 RDD family protein [Lysinibacillus sp. JNUCC-52]UED79336.1 RDD family protein [Lysinibacillus sp. CD3-6]
MTNNEFVLQGTPSIEQQLLNKENTPIVTTKYDLKTAGFWVRFWAFILDGLIISAVVGIVVNPIFYLMDWSLSDSIWYAPISIISAILYYCYFVLMTKFLGQTLGKMAFGLRVVSLQHDKLTWSDVLFREWIGRLISNIIMPLYIFVAILPDNQGIHDYFADTTVVHEKVYVAKETAQPVAQPTAPIQENTKEPEKIEEKPEES